MSRIRMLATNRLIDLAEPVPDVVEIADIAHGLSQINRFTGHTSRAYSVAEHSLMVSWAVPEHMALEALMHDASEAYLGDVSSPLKALLPAYQMLEAQWMRAICEKFGLGSWQTIEIRQADAMALNVELSLLVMREPNLPGEIGMEAKGMAHAAARMRATLLRNRAMTPREAHREFLERFHELVAKRALAALDQRREA